MAIFDDRRVNILNHIHTHTLALSSRTCALLNQVMIMFNPFSWLSDDFKIN
jgi:hypothetical protein